MAQAGDPDHPAPTRERADRLVDEIDAGEVDPADVDIAPFVANDSDVFTPELAERLPDETVERYNERVASKHEQQLRDEMAEQAGLDEDHQQAVEALTSATDGQTAEINLTDGIDAEDQLVDVKTYVPGEVERQLSQSGPLDEHIDALIAALTTMIEAPEEYANPDVWELVYEQSGALVLGDYLENVLGPAEAVDSFRDE